MAKAKTKNKIPEESTASKTSKYKGETRTLRKRLDSLEKRIYILEEKLAKYKNLGVEKALNFGKSKNNKKDDFRKDFLKKHNPSYKEEDE